MKTNAKHLTANGKRKSVCRGTVVQVWLDDCLGKPEPASVDSDLGWGNLNVRIEGKLARVSWSDLHNAYRIMWLIG